MMKKRVLFDLPEFQTVDNPAAERDYFMRIFDLLERELAAGRMRIIYPVFSRNWLKRDWASFYQAANVSIYFQLSGGCGFRLENKTIEVYPGDILVLDGEKAELELSNNFGGDDFINLVVLAGLKYSDFHIGCSGRGRISERKPLVGPQVRLDDTVFYHSLVTTLVRDLGDGFNGRHPVAEKLCMVLIEALRRDLLEARRGIGPEEEFHPCRLARKARLLIVSEAPETFHSATTLADRLGCSPNHLAWVFRRDYRISIKRYVDELRWELARKLLRQNQLTIAEIAELCGFAHPAYFTKRFRERFGILPSESR